MSVGGFVAQKVVDSHYPWEVFVYVLLGSGTLYFTSIRKEKGHPFTICEFSLSPIDFSQEDPLYSTFQSHL